MALLLITGPLTQTSATAATAAPAVTAMTAASDVPPLSVGSASPLGLNDAPMTTVPAEPKSSRTAWRSAHAEPFSYIHWYTASSALATAPIHSVSALL